MVAARGERSRSEAFVYVCGGLDAGGASLSTVERYDVQARTWESVAPMPSARHSAASATDADGRLYVFGGQNGASRAGGASILQSVLRYDPSQNVWEELPELLHARHSAGAAFVRGHLYVVGGHEAVLSTTMTDDSEGNRVGSKIVQRFDPQRNAWSQVADLLQACGQTTTAAEEGGKLYVSGSDGRMQVYDPSNGEWELIECPWKMQFRRIEKPCARSGYGLAALDGKLYAVGGNEDSTEVNRYQPEHRRWDYQMRHLYTERSDSSGPRAMRHGRSGLAVGASAGKLYVAGGAGKVSETDPDGKPLDVVECYDPLFDVWVTLPPLLTARCWASGSVVQEQRSIRSPSDL